MAPPNELPLIYSFSSVEFAIRDEASAAPPVAVMSHSFNQSVVIVLFSVMT